MNKIQYIVEMMTTIKILFINILFCDVIIYNADVIVDANHNK